MAENKKIDETHIITVEGKKNLENRLKYLINVERPKNIEELTLARSQGDLSENADYDAAREKQKEIAAEIEDIQHKLDTYQVVVKDKNFNGVQINSIVTIHRLSDNKDVVYKIVGSSESNLDAAIRSIACDTPIGLALMNHVVGDTVDISTPVRTYKATITSIK